MCLFVFQKMCVNFSVSEKNYVLEMVGVENSRQFSSKLSKAPSALHNLPKVSLPEICEWYSLKKSCLCFCSANGY